MGDEFEIILKETVVTASRYYPSIFLELLRKTTTISVRIASVPTKIRTEQPQNTSVEQCRYAYGLDGN